MTRSSTYVAAFLVALLLAPGALASWRSLGSYEPDTSFDRTDGFMFQFPNDGESYPTITNRVYLNVVATQYLTATNPNMAVQDSRLLSTSYALEAFYGVWVDCNQDGYIGMADSALLEYRAELLPPDHICGKPSGSNMHNQQNWVSELRWIGAPGGADSPDPDEFPDGRDNRLIGDWNADIWGDNGAPGVPIPLSSAASCALFYHRTGQALTYADCRLLAQTGESRDTARDTRNVALDAIAPTGLGFETDENGEVDYDQAHPANVETFGENDGANPAVTVWDCSSGRQGVQTGMGAKQGTQEVPIGTTGYSVYAVEYTDEEGELNFSVYRSYQMNGSEERNHLTRQDVEYFAPVVPTTQSGSVAGAMNHTSDGATGDCDPSNGGGNVTRGSTRVNYGDLYTLESPPVDVREPGKRSVDIEFSFREEQRSGASKKGEPFDRGIYPVIRDRGVFFTGHRWFGGNNHGATPPVMPGLLRGDLTIGGARYFTFYANVSAETISTHALDLPTGGVTGTYGSDWCNGATSGIIDGFNCNPDQWYINPDGSRLQGREHAVLAGHAYHFRDVDCYDYRVGADGSPVYLSGAAANAAARCAE